MKLMFAGAESFDVDVAQWDVSQLQDAESMFEGASSFTGRGIEGWSTATLTNMKAMFKYVDFVRFLCVLSYTLLFLTQKSRLCELYLYLYILLLLLKRRHCLQRADWQAGCLQCY